MNNLNSSVDSVYYLPPGFLSDLERVAVSTQEVISLIKDRGNLTLALELMDECEEPAKPDENLKNILHYAAANFFTQPKLAAKIIKKWIAKGLPVNEASSDGSTFSHCLMEACNSRAAAFRVEEVFRLILWMLHENISIDPFQFNNSYLSAVDLLYKNRCLPIRDRIYLADLFLEFVQEEDKGNCIRDILLLPYAGGAGVFFNDEEIVAMVRHYSKMVDIDFIYDANRVPLLLQPFHGKGYTPRVSIKIAKAMIECGADPNVTDVRGETLLMHVIDLLPLSEETVIRFITYLLERGADPKVSNKYQLGCVHRIFHSLDKDLTREVQCRLLEKMYREDIGTELFFRQLLVNLFDLPDYKTKIYNEKFDIEGVRSLGKLYSDELLISENEKFYANLVKRPIWGKLESRLSGSTKSKFRQLGREQKTHLFENLRRVSSILRLSSNTEKLQFEEYFQVFTSNESFALMMSHQGSEGEFRHAVGFFNHWDYILVSNRGYASGNYLGVTVHRKSDIPEIDRMCADLFSALEAEDFMNRHFKDRMVAHEHSLFNKIVYHLPETSQVGGNCPISSYESLELSILFMLINDFVNDQECSEELARAIRDAHLSSRRKVALSHYLKFHEKEGKREVPIDHHLLVTLSRHKTSNAKEDAERRQKIVWWVVRNYPFAQLTNDISHRSKAIASVDSSSLRASL